MQRQLEFRRCPLCCLSVGSSVEGDGAIAAAFFDLDKTIISRSSALAFWPSFYKHGLISRGEAVRTAVAQLVFMFAGADHKRMERLRTQVADLCRGWPADGVRDIVLRHLNDTILPLVYAEARRLMAAHFSAGRDVIIVSTSGLELVGPIGDLLGASEVIATKMQVTDGCYTGEMEFWAYGEAKAHRMRELALARGYSLADCYAYSDSVTDLPMLEAVGHPSAVNPDRALRKIARSRHWPVLDFGGADHDRPGAGPQVPEDSAREPAAAQITAVHHAHACEPADQSRSRIDHGEDFTSAQISRRNELRTQSPGTAAGHPRATSRGRRAAQADRRQGPAGPSVVALAGKRW
jgi:HAD superfamily hydrolase (TIGR01490 family)